MASYRKVVFANDYYYHIFNRGIERRIFFTNRWEYQRAIELINYYRYENHNVRYSKYLNMPIEQRKEIMKNMEKINKRIVDIIAYCLMPNHFHFLIKQIADNGISTFIANFTNSYTKYFNTKHERNGTLLQGPFKAVFVETDEQLMHLSRYIHLNPLFQNIVKEKDLERYLWSSFNEYLNSNSLYSICQKEIVLNNFFNIKKYREFVYDHISYAKELEKIKHLLME